MNTKIDKFFNFLKDKEERDFPVTYKLFYRQDLLKKEDLIFDFLYLLDEDIKSLPDGMTIKYSLTATSNRTLTLLPDNLTIGGNLAASYTEINNIPNNLKVEGHFLLRGTPLSRRMSSEEIKKEIEKKGGYVYGRIISMNI